MKHQYQNKRILNRRVFLNSGIVLGGATLAGATLLRGADNEKEHKETEIPVGPPEDLMREHGVLKRVLLIYGEARETGFSSRRLGECGEDHSELCRRLP